MSSRLTARVFAYVALLLLVCNSAMADEGRVLRFKSRSKTRVGGQDRPVILGETATGRTYKLVSGQAPTTKPADVKPAVPDLLDALKPGDWIEVSWSTDADVNTMSSIARYTPKAGELQLGGYLYVRSDPSDTKAPTHKVVLKKLGEITETALICEKDSLGDWHEDPMIETVLTDLHEGDSVWADLGPAAVGSAPTLLALLPWKEEQKAKLVKIEPIEQDGDPRMALQVMVGDKQVPLFVPGKLLDGKWTPDARLMNEARRCKLGYAVLYRTQQSGDVQWLRFVEPEPIHVNPKPVNGSGVGRSGGGSGGNSGDNGRDKNGLPRPRLPGNQVPTGVGIPGGF